jgi:hypothetical protein
MFMHLSYHLFVMRYSNPHTHSPFYYTEHSNLNDQFYPLLSAHSTHSSLQVSPCPAPLLLKRIRFETGDAVTYYAVALSDAAQVPPPLLCTCELGALRKPQILNGRRRRLCRPVTAARSPFCSLQQLPIVCQSQGHRTQGEWTQGGNTVAMMQLSIHASIVCLRPGNIC